VRVAVLGATGQLGTDLAAHFAAAGDEVARLGHDAVRVEDAASVRDALAAARPEVVVNTAAFHPLGRCEEEPERAFAVNALGARHVARACRELGARQVFVSTDYVFDGRAGRAYSEEDTPRPISVYGASKLAGEHLALAEAGASSWVVRVSAIYGRVPSRAKGDNFLTMILRRAREQPEVRVVDDEIVSPTPTAEIARALRELLLADRPGLYHLACEGSCSWHELTQVLFELRGIDTPLRAARASDFPGPNLRPAHSALASRRYREVCGHALPHWRDALAAHLASGALAEAPPRDAAG